MEYKKKHLDNELHNTSSTTIINRYYVKNPELIEIVKILRKHVFFYNKKFQSYSIICEWKLQFLETILHVKSKRMYNRSFHWGLIRYLTGKIDYLSRRGQKFSYISEKNITFTADLKNMTYAHYLEQPKQMIEWTLNKKYIETQNLQKCSEIYLFPLINKSWEWET